MFFRWIAGSIFSLVLVGSFYSSANIKHIEVEEVKIALLGDTEAKEAFGSAIRLSVAEGADVIMINGDLGYRSSARKWKERLVDNADIDSVSVIGSIGNHDTRFGQASSYVSAFESLRNDKNMLNTKCTGKTGISEGHDIIIVDEVCTFGNVSVIASGIGQVLDDSYLEQRLESKLSRVPEENWKFVGYHYTLESMNPGLKDDESTYEFFDLIRRYGAIGAQAHTHTVMASCPIVSPFKRGADVKCHEDFGKDLEDRFIYPGVGMYLDSSLGGKGARERQRCFTGTEADCHHMVDLVSEEGYTRRDGHRMSGFDETGVLFITFNAGGDPTKATAYYKTIDGTVVFRFSITR